MKSVEDLEKFDESQIAGGPGQHLNVLSESNNYGQQVNDHLLPVFVSLDRDRLRRVT